MTMVLPFYREFGGCRHRYFSLKTDKTNDPRDESSIILLHCEKQSACLIKKDIVRSEITFLKCPKGPSCGRKIHCIIWYLKERN